MSLSGRPFRLIPTVPGSALERGHRRQRTEEETVMAEAPQQDGIADEEAQALADATEAALTERYDRLRHVLAILDDASRRADAMLRLELSLRSVHAPTT